MATTPRTGRPKGASTNDERVRYRMERIVRLSLRGWKDVEIAKYLGVTPQTVQNDKNNPEFPAIELRISQGVIGDLDNQLAEGDYFKKYTRKVLLPAAFEALADAVLDKRVSLTTRLKAATEILDRDGQFAKVSRVGLSGSEQGGLVSGDDNSMADALIAALGGAAARK